MYIVTANSLTREWLEFVDDMAKAEDLARSLVNAGWKNVCIYKKVATANRPEPTVEFVSV